VKESSIKFSRPFLFNPHKPSQRVLCNVRRARETEGWIKGIGAEEWGMIFLDFSLRFYFV